MPTNTPGRPGRRLVAQPAAQRLAGEAVLEGVCCASRGEAAAVTSAPTRSTTQDRLSTRGPTTDPGCAGRCRRRAGQTQHQRDRQTETPGSPSRRWRWIPRSSLGAAQLLRCEHARRHRDAAVPPGHPGPTGSRQRDEHDEAPARSDEPRTGRPGPGQPVCSAGSHRGSRVSLTAIPARPRRSARQRRRTRLGRAEHVPNAAATLLPSSTASVEAHQSPARRTPPRNRQASQASS